VRKAGCGQLFFGGRNDKAFGFEGRLDEAALFNRALSAKEIADHVAGAQPKSVFDGGEFAAKAQETEAALLD
jgi:hypothetical protein